jgi:hypothetical protein
MSCIIGTTSVVALHYKKGYFLREMKLVKSTKTSISYYAYKNNAKLLKYVKTSYINNNQETLLLLLELQ